MIFNIESKFDIGDIAYRIRPFPALIDCPICHGKGQVKIEYKQFVCPQCKGEKQILSKTIQLYKVCEITIFSIRAYLHGTVTQIKYKVNDIKAASRGMPVIDESNVYKTHDEAQAECDKRNRVVKEDNTPCQN